MSDRYTALYRDHAASPRNMGVLPHWTSSGSAIHPDHHDRVRFYLRIEAGAIAAVSFEGSGCGPLLAAASWLTATVGGQPVAQIVSLAAYHLVQALGLSPDDAHAAWLALKALHAGLQDDEARRAGGRRVS